MSRETDPDIKTRLLTIPRVIAIAALSVYYALRVILTMAAGSNKKLMHRHTRRWGQKVLKVSGVHVETDQPEPPESGQSYIYASNHSNLFDIPVMLASLPDDLRIIYKKELEKIPIFGWGLKKSLYISIDRSDPRRSMQSMEEAIESIRSGDSVIIYPEGTRSRDGSLGQFKRGAFMLASRSGKPIVPIALTGTRECFTTNPFTIRSGNVKMMVHPPVENRPANKAEEMELMTEIRSIIEGMLERGTAQPTEKKQK